MDWLIPVAAGGNLRSSEFQISYALLAHTQCGMANLISCRQQFVEGLVKRGGWQREWAARTL